MTFRCSLLLSVFVQSLKFLKTSLPSNFPDLEKVWKMEIKSVKMVKSCNKCFISVVVVVFFFFVLVKSYSISPIRLQCIFLRSLLITYLITLNLENEINVLEKSLEKVLKLGSKICANLDCKKVGFFLTISKEIGKAWRKSRRACEAREKKTDCPFRSDQGVQKCRRAIKKFNLFTTPPSL